ncbi:MAG TPA: hypothetical protein VKB76_19365, partial [Ktedonobacterales bacterium]|nr:hypothetical protein [Ktedonobacterales bacterium]
DYILDQFYSDRDNGGQVYRALQDLTHSLLGFDSQRFWNPNDSLKHDIVGIYMLDSPPTISYPEVFAVLSDEK